MTNHFGNSLETSKTTITSCQWNTSFSYSKHLQFPSFNAGFHHYGYSVLVENFQKLENIYSNLSCTEHSRFEIDWPSTKIWHCRKDYNWELDQINDFPAIFFFPFLVEKIYMIVILFTLLECSWNIGGIPRYSKKIIWCDISYTVIRMFHEMAWNLYSISQSSQIKDFQKETCVIFSCYTSFF